MSNQELIQFESEFAEACRCMPEMDGSLSQQI